MAGDSEQTKKKILDNASVLFAQNGFNATRLTDVAKKCGISKALIYYNYPSKEAVLAAVMDRFKLNIKRMFQEVFLVEKESDHGTQKWSTDELKRGMDVFLSHRHEFTILISESLKSGNDSISLLEFWSDINQMVRNDILEQRGYSLVDEDLQHSMTDYFFILIPTVFFSIMGSEWADQNNFPQRAADEEFNRQLINIYDKYLGSGA